MEPTFNFTVAPHLEQYNVPFSDFRARNPDLTHFVGGALIFSRTAELKPENLGEVKQPDAASPLRILLLQRSLEDSWGGHWEGPGGSCEPEDESLLVGVAREVFEESGLHVSKFVDFVAMDKWVSVKPHTVYHVAKFTFLVEVHESASLCWEDHVKVDPKEHQAFAWVTEEELREGEEQKAGKYQFLGTQGQTMLAAFQLVKAAA